MDAIAIARVSSAESHSRTPGDNNGHSLHASQSRHLPMSSWTESLSPIARDSDPSHNRQSPSQHHKATATYLQHFAAAWSHCGILMAPSYPPTGRALACPPQRDLLVEQPTDVVCDSGQVKLPTARSLGSGAAGLDIPTFRAGLLALTLPSKLGRTPRDWLPGCVIWRIISSLPAAAMGLRERRNAGMQRKFEGHCCLNQ